MGWQNVQINKYYSNTFIWIVKRKRRQFKSIYSLTLKYIIRLLSVSQSVNPHIQNWFLWINFHSVFSLLTYLDPHYWVFHHMAAVRTVHKMQITTFICTQSEVSYSTFKTQHHIYSYSRNCILIWNPYKCDLKLSWQWLPSFMMWCRIV